MTHAEQYAKRYRHGDRRLSSSQYQSMAMVFHSEHGDYFPTIRFHDDSHCIIYCSVKGKEMVETYSPKEVKV